MQHLGYDVAHWQTLILIFTAVSTGTDKNWIHGAALSPGSVPDVGAELLQFPGVILLCLICLGFLIHFGSFSFHHWTAPAWLQFTVKESLEKCQDSKWEQRFCISKRRKSAGMALESCIMLNYFFCLLQRHKEQLLWTQFHSLTCFMAFQYSQPCFPVDVGVRETCCLCKRVTFFPRCTEQNRAGFNPWCSFGP